MGTNYSVWVSARWAQKCLRTAHTRQGWVWLVMMKFCLGETWKCFHKLCVTYSCISHFYVNVCSLFFEKMTCKMNPPGHLWTWFTVSITAMLVQVLYVNCRWTSSRQLTGLEIFVHPFKWLVHLYFHVPKNIITQQTRGQLVTLQFDWWTTHS